MRRGRVATDSLEEWERSYQQLGEVGGKQPIAWRRERRATEGEKRN